MPLIEFPQWLFNVTMSVRSLPVLLIVTFRPEFQSTWTGQPQVTILALNRANPRIKKVRSNSLEIRERRCDQWHRLAMVCPLPPGRPPAWHTAAEASSCRHGAH